MIFMFISIFLFKTFFLPVCVVNVHVHLCIYIYVGRFFVSVCGGGQRLRLNVFFDCFLLCYILRQSLTYTRILLIWLVQLTSLLQGFVSASPKLGITGRLLCLRAWRFPGCQGPEHTLMLAEQTLYLLGSLPSPHMFIFVNISISDIKFIRESTYK